MSVYYVTCRTLGLVKIGHANDPKRRFQGFKTSSPVPIALEAQSDGGEAEERDLHARFAELREIGEWFRLCPEIEALIERHRLPEPQPRKARKSAGIFDPVGWVVVFGDRYPMPEAVRDWFDRHPDAGAELTARRNEVARVRGEQQC
jgi:hypothetical protein